MHCYLCGDPLSDALQPSVPSSDGGRVHIACADRAGLAAWRQRSLLAVSSSMSCFALLLIARLNGAGMLVLAVLLTLLAAGHLRLNKRWWRHMRQLLRLHVAYRFRSPGHRS